LQRVAAARALGCAVTTFETGAPGDAEAIARLRDVQHVYVPPDGRINVAGVSEANVDRVADSLVAVMG